MKPKVTVLMPVFNRPELVDEAIRSIVEQDFADFELLVVDDGSTDRTPEVLESWMQRDPRIVVVTAPTNLGLPAALNLGLARARGEYIARHDSDDLMCPRRLAAQAAVLDSRPDVTLVSCAFEIVDLAGNHLGMWKSDESHEVTAFLLHFANVVGGAQTMFRLADVLADGGYRLDYPACEDYDLCVRLLQRGRIETLPLVGMTNRRHAGQTWPQWGLRKRPYWTAIMRSSLEPYLQRSVSDAEIGALITVWRRDRVLGDAPLADEVMREAYARFRREIADPGLHKRVRKEFVRRWSAAAWHFARRRNPLEAVRYLVRAARWVAAPPA